MGLFRRLSIQRRLMLIILLPTALTLFLGGVAFYLHERAELVGGVTRELHILAEVTGANCAGAVSFDDKAQAEKTLATLSHNPAIEQAVLYGKLGQVFARYPARGAAPPVVPADGVTTDSASLSVVLPIELDGERIATISVRESLAPVLNRLRQILALTALVMGSVTMCALWLTFLLQRAISQPIVELTHATRQVNETRNYAIRARKLGEDELGQLTDCFNDMLAAIESNREALVSAKEAATAGTHAKSDFLARMSHEIRTPLNGVIGLTSLLADTPLTDQQREYVSLARTSAEALRGLVNDILDFSKIEAGSLELEVVEFDLPQLVEETLAIFADQLRRKSLTAAAGIAPDVPRRVRGDPGRLREILMNLLSNAIKFTRRGEIVVQLQRRADEGSSHRLSFEVRDSGIGISEADAARLFQPFSQLASPGTSQQPGTGLGLAICRQLCQLMGGDIQVKGELGRGSRFNFTVALGSVAAASDEPPPRSLERVRVLVALRDDMVTAVIHDQLTAHGVAPTLAYEAETARDLLANPALDFDVLLVESEWLTFIERPPARKLDRLPLVVMCAWGAKPARLTLQLTSPVRPSALLDCLRQALAGELPAAPVAPVSPAERKDVPLRTDVRVLVVDDNVTNQMVATMMLKAHGIPSDVAFNGAEALEKLAHAPYDLVLMDCQMPVMNGFEATRGLRTREASSGRRTPVVALTAAAVAGDRQRCLDADMDDYLTKPIDRNELLRVLRERLPVPPTPIQPVDPRSNADAAIEPPPGLDYVETLARTFNGRREAYMSVARVFLTSATENVAGLDRAVSTGVWEEGARLAHKLRGSAAMLGARVLADATLTLERALSTPGAAPDRGLVEAQVQIIRSEVAQMGVFIARMTAPLPAA